MQSIESAKQGAKIVRADLDSSEPYNNSVEDSSEVTLVSKKKKVKKLKVKRKIDQNDYEEKQFDNDNLRISVQMD